MPQPELEEVLVRLCRGAVVLGPRYSVGPYTPAVPDPDGYSWCVMDRGGPIVLAFDAFEAARYFIEAELTDEPWEGESPIRLKPDAEVAAMRGEESLREWFYRCDLWLEMRRKTAGRAA